MTARGIKMIHRIQGPPRWNGPEVLLRQTSFEALAEPRLFRELDGRDQPGHLRSRFGEVEARGIALTPPGRDLHASLTVETRDLTDIAAAAVWAQRVPASERGLAWAGLANFSYAVAKNRPSGIPPSTLDDLVARRWLDLEPIVYEDFLPRSVAGICASNLTCTGQGDLARCGSNLGANRTMGWLSGEIGRTIHTPESLYADQSRRSLRDVAPLLGVPSHQVGSSRLVG